jgi:hypothetical protein
MFDHYPVSAIRDIPIHEIITYCCELEECPDSKSDAILKLKEYVLPEIKKK